MMTAPRFRLLKSAAILLAAGCSLPACAERAEPVEPEPYLRVQETEETGGVNLQIALRTFQRGPNEPTLTLVGVAHIGTPAYYEQLEERLDAHDLVLFEGVGPSWASLKPDAPDPIKVSATRSRIRMVAVSAMQRRNAGLSVQTLEDTYAGASSYEALLIKKACVDAWGRPLLFEATDEGFVIQSLGADGEPGGRGYDTDHSLADLRPIMDEELEVANGIQTQLAEAAGLVFQLSSMDYVKPNWVNSDTTAEALSFAMAGLDPDDAQPSGGVPATGGGDPLFELMSGRGFMGKLIGGVLKFVGASPQSRAMLRLMLIETLSNADEMMDLAGGLGGDEDGAGAGIQTIMDVLINQRNEIVLADIEDAIEHARLNDGDPETIAVFYGGGHLLEMERSLATMGYTPTGTEWLDAFGVSPEDTGMSAQQIAGMRGMMQSMIQSQVEGLRRMQKQE